MKRGLQVHRLPCQVVRILQDVFASSPTVLFSQNRTPQSIAQSSLPPGSPCSCHSFHVQALRWGHGLQVHCGVSRIHSFELTARWVGDASGSYTEPGGCWWAKGAAVGSVPSAPLSYYTLSRKSSLPQACPKHPIRQCKRAETKRTEDILGIWTPHLLTKNI